MPRIAACEPPPIGSLDVVGHILAVGHIAQRQATTAQQGHQVAQSGGFIELGQHQRRDAHIGELLGRLLHALEAVHAAEHQMHFVGLRLRQHASEFLDLHVITRASAGRVHQDQVEIRQPIHGLSHLPRCGDDFHGQVDDVRIGSQLFHGRDAVSVHRDQAHTAAFPQMEVPGQLGDRRGLSDTRGADQCHQPAFARRDTQRTRHVDLLLDQPTDAGLEQDGVVEITVGGALPQVVDQFTSQFLAHFRINQVGEEVEERLRHFLAGGRPFAAAQILDHRLQTVHLTLQVVAELRSKILFVSGRDVQCRVVCSPGSRLRPRPARRAARIRCVRKPTGHVDRGRSRHLDLPDARQSLPKTAPHLPRVQHGGVGSQIVAHQLQGFLHGTSSIRLDVHRVSFWRVWPGP